MIASFPSAWLSMELKGFRDHPEPFRTYSAFDIDSLPDIPEEQFNGSFLWLLSDADASKQHSVPDPLAMKVLSPLEEQAGQSGVLMPKSFRTFFTDSVLRKLIRSATDCGFDLPCRLIPVPWEDGYLLRFMADSQGCLFWYLFLAPNGGHCVVVASKCYGGDPFADREFWEKHLGPDWDAEDPPKESDKIWYCAPSFESFIYRFWIENEIWYSLRENGRAASQKQNDYLQHYKLT